MKATGIVRRIDDLGRVVIPKEIRRTLRIKEGTPLEIFTDKEGEVILKKYSPIGELSVFAKEYAESLAQTTGMREMKCYHTGERKILPLVENQKESSSELIVQPIICSGDAIGSVALVGKSAGERFGNSEQMLVKTAAGFLGRQMEQ